ncbi:transposase [Holdemanella biformis]|uniref:transposase n=1 Tax=Holdemanella biformis TaxID=1735 RepID=UPI001896DD54|nr:transposase [Holdemanella biformis]
MINSFTRIKVYRKNARTEKEYYARFSNGPMESFNRKPKDLKRDSRGFSDFYYTRNRILWATRKNPSIKGVPKSMDQIRSKKGSQFYNHN